MLPLHKSHPSPAVPRLALSHLLSTPWPQPPLTSTSFSFSSLVCGPPTTMRRICSRTASLPAAARRALLASPPPFFLAAAAAAAAAAAEGCPALGLAAALRPSVDVLPAATATAGAAAAVGEGRPLDCWRAGLPGSVTAAMALGDPLGLTPAPPPAAADAGACEG